jgi:quinol monooxygenase YgiN
MAQPLEPASESSGARFFTVTYVDVVPSQAEAAAGVLAGAQLPIGERVRARVDRLRRLGRSNQFAILAACPDQQAFDELVALDPGALVDGTLGDVGLCPSDTRQHALLTRGKAPGSAQDLVVVTHVDVVPQSRDDGAVALQELARASGGQPGCQRFEVWQQINRPNHFTVVEAWEHHEAFEGHVAADATRRFRTLLVPMTGALYDERMYALLK